MVELSRLSAQQPLIILDIANNHNGSVDHGMRIIDGLAEALLETPLRIALKFQYRDLDSFIHPDFRTRMDLKYVNRFLTTRLSWNDFAQLTRYAKSRGFLTAATPFDEVSVRFVVEHEHDFLKVASASFTDWPLWEAVAETDLPIVASTAAASLEEIDRVVSFLTNRGRDFALMHCVAAYPTAAADLLLSRIDVLRERYPSVTVGFSTHEDPHNWLAGPLAIAKGASLLERHVGEATSDLPLNDYSSEPQTIRGWLSQIEQSIEMNGAPHLLTAVNPAEQQALHGLRRGVFAAGDIESGTRLRDEQVFFAIPMIEGQVSANEWSKYLALRPTADVSDKEPLVWTSLSAEDRNRQVLGYVEAVTSFLQESGVSFPANAEMELSHHYGLDKFSSIGMAMITVVNREYCKKLLVMLPGQTHPEQWHNVKEETFHVLHGDVSLWLDDHLHLMTPGDITVVERGVRHRFSSSGGCVIEEISTRHEPADSFYVDDSININPDRKTFVTYWGSVGRQE